MQVQGTVLTVLAFVVGLGLLIGVHEWGHFQVARWSGVKVLRFSIGMGPVVWRWQSPRSGVEYALSAIPLGGYVRMLDGREAMLSPQERRLAFDAQPLRKRAAIVLAGPMANFLLAWLIYAGLNAWGMPQAAPVLAAPVEGSALEQAGLQTQDEVKALTIDGQTRPVRSYEDLLWMLTPLASARGAAEVGLDVQRGSRELHIVVRLEADGEAAAPQVFDRWGLAGPWMAARITGVAPGSAAEQAGLQEGDEVLRVDGRLVGDAAQLRRWIARSAQAAPSSATATDGAQGLGPTLAPQRWEVLRHGQRVTLEVVPRAQLQGKRWVGRVGAYIGEPAQRVATDLSLAEAAARAAHKVWDVATLSLDMLGKMLTGQASLSHLSGPLTIADYAGRTAQAGWVPYVSFLALISVSLGVLNLLPLPMLDGGHLMVYIYEGLTRHPLSERAHERLQRAGLAVLLAAMSLALYNDLARLLG